MTNWKIENGKLIVELNMESREVSKSGKSYLLASSHGYQWDNEKGIGVSFNVIRKRERRD